MGSLVNVFLAGRYKLITNFFFAMAVGEYGPVRHAPQRPALNSFCVNRVYAAGFVTAVKKGFRNLPSWFDLEKVFFFVARLSCEGHDSTNFHQNVFILQIQDLDSCLLLHDPGEWR
jgi:hypothetical protein